MNAGAVLWLVVIGGVVLAAANAAGRAVQVIGGLFKPPVELGWPPGVQEDDDLTWNWSAAASRGPDRDRPSAEDRDDPRDSLRVPVQRVPYPPRSTRARS